MVNEGKPTGYSNGESKMDKLRRILFTLSALELLISASLAQSTQPTPDPADTAAGCAVCGTLLFIPIVIFVLNIALLIWVARDAKARGMDSAVLWMILVMVTSVIGLIIYLFSRPQGNLIRCTSCSNNRLQASAKCPHCGNA